MNLLASLRNRVFLASVLLAAITIGFAILVISARVTEQAERELQRGLNESAMLLQQQHSALSQLYLLRARLVANLPVLKSAVDTRDPATVADVAPDFQHQLDADVLLITDRDGRVLFGSPGAETLEDRGMIQRAVHGDEVAAFAAHSRGLLQVVTVPIALGVDLPDILGTLTAGFLLDDRRAQEFKRAAASDVAFVMGGRIQAATLPRSDRGVLQDHMRADRTISHVTLGGEDYVFVGLGLKLPVAARETTETAPVALVLRSRSSHLRALRTIQGTLLAAAGLAVGLAVMLSYIVARSVTTPLGTITAEMRQMAATGDLTRKIHLREPAWLQDEDARVLATAFNTLTDSIARFQREAAQRDRLLALGRLSTVVAHEVRNPLMIIKGTLRPLHSESLPPDVREAAADIDEQVARLNRIVHDVLDFARPLRFEVSEANLAAICEEAAAAVMKGDAAPPIRVEAEPVPIVTDAERLRSALINVLTNARQASTTADQTGAGPDRPIVLTAARAGTGQIRVTVRDNGPGIAPEHLAHVFEPYYTTRRAGTGLGLAITRNIVEGLGGNISVQSASPGTIVQIDLPVVVESPVEATRA